MLQAVFGGLLGLSLVYGLIRGNGGEVMNAVLASAPPVEAAGALVVPPPEEQATSMDAATSAAAAVFTSLFNFIMCPPFKNEEK